MTKFSKRKKESRKNFIDILFHLSNQIFILTQFSGTSPYSKLVFLYFVGYHFVMNEFIILLCNINSRI
jgi:hypothetical protein